MQKQKITLPQRKWGTIKSKYRPESNDVTVDEFTAGSVNFITNNTGAIEKRPTDVQYNSTAFTNPPKDQFEAVFSNGVHHLLTFDGGSLDYTTGNGIINVAATGYTPSASMEYSMYQNRVYMDNGIDSPSVYDIAASYGGVTYSVPQVKTMGCQVPGSAATFNADTAGGAVPVGAHTYAVTFLYYGEEESNAGTVSAVHTVAASNFTVNLKTIPTGGYGVTARKIYRDNNDGSYLLVGTISDNTTTTFVDTVSAGTTPLPTANDLPPVFSYIALNLSRQFVAGVPGTPSVLYWSSPDFPDIFDPSNFVICNPKDPINGLYTFQGIMVVLNRHSLGKILGNTDDTFEYEEVSGSVGCVDNRSIQIRTIDGVPVLVWLSDRGFYKFDGSSVTYISDPIEDLVNFNLQQVSFTTGSNNQSTESDYAAGTLSPSIDIASDPNTITVLNPKHVFQAEADWEGGLSLVNIATADGSNQLKVPLLFSAALGDGTVGGNAEIVTVGFTTNLILPTTTSQTVPVVTTEGNCVDFTNLGATEPRGIGQQFNFQHSGTITGLTFYISSQGGGGTVGYTLRIYSDVLDAPGTTLYTSSHSYTQSDPAGTMIPISTSPSLSIVAGTNYWFTVEQTSGANWFVPANVAVQNFNQLTKIKVLASGAWQTVQAAGVKIIFGPLTNNFPAQLPCTFTFTQTPITSSGTWASPVHDSFSIGSAATASVGVGATYPTNCSGNLFVDMSNDPTMSTGVTTFTQASPNGTYTPGLSGNRYWRMRLSLFTLDNRNTPTFTGGPTLFFSTTGTWISQPIDCTTDVTSYDALAVTQNIPSGTSATITVATSADNITYTSFGPVGSAAVHRWVKIKIVLTTNGSDSSTPSVSFLKFSWQQTSTFTSSIIDVGQVPTGWGVFQDAALTNGGTLTFYMRSAASSGAISGASFQAVSNGVFPPASVSPLEFTQWKIVFTSSADALPTVSGVTVNWFIGTTQSPIRAASLFFNKTYYLSAASIGATTNDTVIVWDFEGLWRVFTGVTINSLGLFFNEPFYCDAARNNIYQWLTPTIGTGSAISMDVRTKAFDLGDVNTLKVVRSLRVTGINTGTTIHTYFSVDRGETWIEMLNVAGTLGYVTTTSGSRFSQYFVPDFDTSAVISGTTIMYRVTSTDANPCTIMQLEPVLYTRNGKYLGVAV